MIKNCWVLPFSAAAAPEWWIPPQFVRERCRGSGAGRSGCWIRHIHSQGRNEECSFLVDPLARSEGWIHSAACSPWECQYNPAPLRPARAPARGHSMGSLIPSLPPLQLHCPGPSPQPPPDPFLAFPFCSPHCPCCWPSALLHRSLPRLFWPSSRPRGFPSLPSTVNLSLEAAIHPCRSKAPFSLEKLEEHCLHPVSCSASASPQPWACLPQLPLFPRAQAEEFPSLL